jgi:cytochrome c553
VVAGAVAIRLLSGLLLLAAASVALAADRTTAMPELVWIAPDQAREALARQPAVCALPASDPAQAQAGKALFNAPQLLGGQAARAGISCASCHANGRDNPHFFLAGISATPGTADVSASFFGVARANGTFDPRPIPDLALPGKVAHDPATRALEAFLRGLVVDEFSGREPGDPALGALAAYVRTLRPCPNHQDEPRRVSDQLELVRDSVRGSQWLAGQGEVRMAAVLVAGARNQLGLIHDRYAGPRLGPERRRLLAASRRLQPMAESAAPDPERLAAWLAEFDRSLAPRLVRAERRSLYEPEVLARWKPPVRLEQSGP